MNKNHFKHLYKKRKTRIYDRNLRYLQKHHIGEATKVELKCISCLSLRRWTNRLNKYSFYHFFLTTSPWPQRKHRNYLLSFHKGQSGVSFAKGGRTFPQYLEDQHVTCSSTSEWRFTWPGTFFFEIFGILELIYLFHVFKLSFYRLYLISVQDFQAFGTNKQYNLLFCRVSIVVEFKFKFR